MCITSEAFWVSMSFIFNSCMFGMSFRYALKCFFMMAKFLKLVNFCSKSLVCSTKTFNFSGSPKLDLGLNNHGLPKMARPSMAPSAPDSLHLFMASGTLKTSPLPRINTSLGLRLDPPDLLRNSKRAGLSLCRRGKSSAISRLYSLP